MSDQEPALRVCPYCKEEIKAEALRCKHCHATIRSSGPIHQGICPYCKESINPEAIRCKHCLANLAPAMQTEWRQPYAPPGLVPRRQYRRLCAAGTKATQTTLPSTHHSDAEPRQAPCPATILSSSPDGSGLGVWVLVDWDDQYCEYEYAGGIA